MTLKLTPEQKKQLTDLQKEVDAQARQDSSRTTRRSSSRRCETDFARGGPPGGRPARRPPVAAPAAVLAARVGAPAFLFAGPPGGGALFRAYRYGPDYPGLAGKDLKPGKTVEELQKKEPAKK